MVVQFFTLEIPLGAAGPEGDFLVFVLVFRGTSHVHRWRKGTYFPLLNTRLQSRVHELFKRQ